MKVKKIQSWIKGFVINHDDGTDLVLASSLTEAYSLWFAQYEEEYECKYEGDIDSITCINAENVYISDEQINELNSLFGVKPLDNTLSTPTEKAE